jgi:hypothetical protein
MNELVLENSVVEVIDAEHYVAESHGPMPKTDPSRPVGSLTNDYPARDAPGPKERGHEEPRDRSRRCPQDPPDRPHGRSTRPLRAELRRGP